jgi:hypothetical protein
MNYSIHSYGLFFLEELETNGLLSVSKKYANALGL